MAKKRLSHGLWGIAKVVSLAMAGDYVALGSFAGVVQARTGDLCYFLFFFQGGAQPNSGAFVSNAILHPKETHGLNLHEPHWSWTSGRPYLDQGLRRSDHRAPSLARGGPCLAV